MRFVNADVRTGCHIYTTKGSLRFMPSYRTFNAVKKATSIGLILLMSLQCFYKLGLMTYFQLNREYIAEVLCINKEKPISVCYGQCFLKNKLNLIDGPASDKGTVPIGKRALELPVFLIVDNIYSFIPPLLIRDGYSCRPSVTCSGYSILPFHPPTVVS